MWFIVKHLEMRVESEELVQLVKIFNEYNMQSKINAIVFYILLQDRDTCFILVVIATIFLFPFLSRSLYYKIIKF